MEDNHRGSGGRVGGFAHQQQLLGGSKGRSERRQFFERNVGWQGRVQRQHGGYDAVGQQAFWLHTKIKKKKHKHKQHKHDNILFSLRIPTSNRSQSVSQVCTFSSFPCFVFKTAQAGFEIWTESRKRTGAAGAPT